MAQGTVTMDVRQVSDITSIVDITGEITAACEQPLMEAYEKATGGRTRAVVLNFSGLDYMNSGGIGLLVTLLVRANRHKQRLLAYGLSDHYRQIFEVTRLDDAIRIYDGEEQALASTGQA